ncbi:MAG: GGDEF domain-containing protein [Denitromonas halophila]|nr:MAG: GGDEF domain-containing protein [Denitromonas halophila]TVT71877.1 MAG: GGDEF domain-containing protein [Denitromonas halophila]
MHLDIPTVTFLAAVSCLSVALAMWVVAGRYPPVVARAMFRWGGACGLSAFGALLVFLRGTLPDFLSVVVGNTVIVGGFAMAYHAIRVLHERTGPSDRLAAVWVLVCFALYWTAFELNRDINLRIILVATLKIPVLALIVRELWVGSQRGRRAVELMLLSVYLLYAVVSALRALNVMMTSALDLDSFLSDPVQQFSFVAYFLTLSVSSLFFMLALGEVLTAELYQRATTDPLTGIYNRHAFEELALREISRAQRTGRYPSMLMVDIDHFKQINDRYGHTAGDGVLRAVVGAIQGALRQQDFVGRWGGEEFCVLLPETGQIDALHVAERLRCSVMEMPLSAVAQAVTVSIGVSSPYAHECSFSAMIEVADDALYKAKFGGRNRVVISGV